MKRSIATQNSGTFFPSRDHHGLGSMQVAATASENGTHEAAESIVPYEMPLFPAIRRRQRNAAAGTVSSIGNPKKRNKPMISMTCEALDEHA
jgi:hypothetical protein